MKKDYQSINLQKLTVFFKKKKTVVNEVYK